jgi:hypothetical protein
MALSKIASAGIQDASVAAADLASGAARTNFGAGAVLQATKATSNTLTLNTGTPTDVVSLSITTQANSCLHICFSGDCNAETNGAWKYVGVFIDGIQQNVSITSTAVASYQEVVGLVYLSGPLTAGSHTVAIKSWNGVGTSTWSESGQNGNNLVVLEIAG